MAADQPTPANPFEAIRHETESGGEFWTARELAPLLGYTNWRNFRLAVERAQIACANSGQVVADHFDATIKPIPGGKGAVQHVADWHLSRYACYLVVQNADPKKPIVALGMTLVVGALLLFWRSATPPVQYDQCDPFRCGSPGQIVGDVIGPAGALPRPARPFPPESRRDAGSPTNGR